MTKISIFLISTLFSAVCSAVLPFRPTSPELSSNSLSESPTNLERSNSAIESINSEDSFSSVVLHEEAKASPFSQYLYGDVTRLEMEEENAIEKQRAIDLNREKNMKKIDEKVKAKGSKKDAEEKQYIEDSKIVLEFHRLQKSKEKQQPEIESLPLPPAIVTDFSNVSIQETRSCEASSFEKLLEFIKDPIKCLFN